MIDWLGDWTVKNYLTKLFKLLIITKLKKKIEKSKKKNRFTLKP